MSKQLHCSVCSERLDNSEYQNRTGWCSKECARTAHILNTFEQFSNQFYDQMYNVSQAIMARRS